jgi:hypothetical protein
LAAREPVASSAPGLSPPLPGPVVLLVLDGPICAGDVPALVERLRPELAAGSKPLVTCDVEHVAPTDIGTVDALARLALALRHCGARMRIERASPELRGLLGLAGLRGVVPCDDLFVEVVGQPEQREQLLGVEEERDAGDLSVGDL